MEQTRDRQHTTPLHLRSDFVLFKAMLFVSDDYGTLRDCVERLCGAEPPVSGEFEARRLTAPERAASTMLKHSRSQFQSPCGQRLEVFRRAETAGQEWLPREHR
jgi:hypothetical protein